MKQLIYLFSILLCFSCSNKRNAMKSEDIIHESTSDFINKSQVNSYEKLSIQKLSIYHDLLKLKQQHPEFKDDILIQLKELSKDSILKNNYTSNFTIKNIHQIGKEIIINDSIKKIQLTYQITSKFIKKNDSIYAYIYTKTIFLNAQKKVSNKIKFSKS